VIALILEWIDTAGRGLAWRPKAQGSDASRHSTTNAQGSSAATLRRLSTSLTRLRPARLIPSRRLPLACTTASKSTRSICTKSKRLVFQVDQHTMHRFNDFRQALHDLVSSSSSTYSKPTTTPYTTPSKSTRSVCTKSKRVCLFKSTITPYTKNKTQTQTLSKSTSESIA
jgi:hypothetical protein